MSRTKKRIALLGSTGSIGTQTLQVIDNQTEHFEVVLLTARNNVGSLIEQAKRYLPAYVAITNPVHYPSVKDALSGLPIEVICGDEELCALLESDMAEVVLTAMVGYAGLLPTLAAVESGKTIALANKETLVVAGELVMQKAKARGAAIYPVDSEHSAIFQCLEANEIEKIYLTASGGPFRGKTKAELQNINKSQALKHPNWEMGAKITIDSATLMNKGLEVIEAKWLFDLQPSQIDVIVHSQSIVHSIVQFRDGSMKAQMGLPDMKLPIQYALSYPQRLPNNFPRFDFLRYPNLSFEQPDRKTFRNLDLAFIALEQGGNMPCILNAANEIAVERFLKDEIGFLDIAHLNEHCMEKAQFLAKPDLQTYIETDKEVRLLAQSWK
jgi:1-deoxy-D-xylulose-5-phosphate reductoisomerase